MPPTQQPHGPLYQQATQDARATWPPPDERMPQVFGAYDLARMAQVAVCDLPELTRRFTNGLEQHLARIDRIGRPATWRPRHLRSVA